MDRGGNVVNTFGKLLVIAVALTALYLLGSLVGRGSAAPIPPLFDGSVALSESERLAEQKNRVVLVYATADWCGPCQAFKSSTLVDPRVEEWVGANAVPVYLNVDHEPTDAERFSIVSIPSTILLRNGRVLGKLQGAVGSDEYLEWLKATAAQ